MVDRTNEEWLADLNSAGPAKEAALADLRAAILAGLPYALSNYLSPDNPQFKSLTEEVAQDSLLRVMDHLDTFEGRSRFTTWVQKMLTAHPDVSCEFHRLTCWTGETRILTISFSSGTRICWLILQDLSRKC